MGNSNSSSKAAAVTVAVTVAAATTAAAWVLSSYLSSEPADSHNRSSAHFEFQSGSSAQHELQSGSSSVKDVCYHFESEESCKQKEVVHDPNSGRSKAKQKLKDEANRQIPKHLTPSSDNSVKDVCYHFESEESYKPKEVVHDPDSRRSKAKQKLKDDANRQIPKHLTPSSYNSDKDVCYHFESEESCKQKEVVHDPNSRRSKAKQKLKDEANRQIPKHLTPSSDNSEESCKQKEVVHDPDSRRSKAKQKLKDDANRQIPKHLTPSSYNSVKDVCYHFESEESCKQKEVVHDPNSRGSKAKQKLKDDANRQIPKHLTPSSYNSVDNSERQHKIQFDRSYEDTGVQASSFLVGSKKKTPLSLKKHRLQKSKHSGNKKPRILKRKRKLKVDGDDQISRHLTPRICLQGTIKIMTYNIWSIKYYKKKKRMNAVNHLIEQHSPDIILLQEVTPEVYIYFQSCKWWGIYECSIKKKQTIKQFFCMMLSKLPVNEYFYKRFVNTKTCKGVSVAKFTSNPKETLAVATCHLKSPDGACTYDVERTSQAKEAIDVLKSSPNVVLGGDMNWDESTDGPFPLTSGWCDAWSDLKPEEDGYTYDTESNAMLGGRRYAVQKRLDRFVCRLEDFDMIDIEIVGTEAIKGVLCKSNGGKKLPLLPSDHYGLILTIRAK